MDINYTCTCCSVTVSVFTGRTLDQLRGLINSGNFYPVITCGICGCQVTLQDATTEIAQADTSKPRIDAMSAMSAPLAGLPGITITGHRLNYGTPVIKFAGVPGLNLRNVTATSAVIDAPAGSIRLVEQGTRRRKLTVTDVVGTFQVGEIVTGGTHYQIATIREIAGDHFMVDSVSGGFAHNEVITGTQSGATAKADTLGTLFQVGETVEGLTSGATGVLAIVDAQLRIGAPSGTFQAGEWIRGGTSEAKVQLVNSTPLDGGATVTIENDYGMRALGGSLTGFRYVA